MDLQDRMLRSRTMKEKYVKNMWGIILKIRRTEIMNIIDFRFSFRLLYILCKIIDDTCTL